MVVVGGGIVGASLAFGLASGGLGVVALEPTLDYPDRVPGEAIMPWGVKEASALGVDKVLLEMPARVSSVWREYDDGLREKILMSEVIEGVPGALKTCATPTCARRLLRPPPRPARPLFVAFVALRLTAGRSVTVFLPRPRQSPGDRAACRGG